MTTKIPAILEHLRDIDINNESEIRVFLKDLKSYQDDLLHKLQMQDGKLHGADDLLPALEKELAGIIDKDDAEKIQKIYDFCMEKSEEVEQLEVTEAQIVALPPQERLAAAAKLESQRFYSASEYLYAIVSLNGITQYIAADNKNRHATIVLQQSLYQGIQFLQKTTTLFQKLSVKEPQKYNVTLEELNKAINDLKKLHTETGIQLGQQELPLDYFKKTFKKFHEIMATARNKVDDRSEVQKIFDKVVHIVVSAINKMFRSFNRCLYKMKFFGPKPHRNTQYKFANDDPKKVALDLVEMEVYKGLKNGDLSESFYNELPEENVSYSKK